jgi:hypothetical protein
MGDSGRDKSGPYNWRNKLLEIPDLSGIHLSVFREDAKDDHRDEMHKKRRRFHENRAIDR